MIDQARNAARLLRETSVIEQRDDPLQELFGLGETDTQQSKQSKGSVARDEDTIEMTQSDNALVWMTADGTGRPPAELVDSMQWNRKSSELPSFIHATPRRRRHQNRRVSEQSEGRLARPSRTHIGNADKRSATVCRCVCVMSVSL